MTARTQEVKIPENSFLNGGKPRGDDPNNGDQKGMPDEVFQNLPEILRKTCCDILVEQGEKEAFLVGALGVISGIIPNVQGFYDQVQTGPNLFVYLVGSYGSGKGFLKYTRELAWPIHKDKRDEFDRALQDYEEELNAATKTKKQPPQKPENSMLFLPANSSRSGFIQVLHENKGKGILFETEGDTLANSLTTDYGNFSDLLRKAFHGEPYTFFRRAESEYREIECPTFSVVISSTFDQLLNLIPTIQNGLYSRFLFYHLQGDSEFRNVFNRSKSEYPRHFEEQGKKFFDMYNALNKRETSIQFNLQPKQEIEFVNKFKEWKREIGEVVGADLNGMVNRLGLIAFRIAMQFTVLRAFEVDRNLDSKELACSEKDFKNALRIVEALQKNAIDIYHRLPRPKVSPEASKLEIELGDKISDVAKCRKLRAEGKSYAEIAEKVLGDSKKKGTVFKWVNYCS